MNKIITRRGFLTGMLALSAAPTIVKAENLMKIVVPPKKILLLGRGLNSSIFHIDEGPWQPNLTDNFQDYIDKMFQTRKVDESKVEHRKPLMVRKKDGRLEPFDLENMGLYAN